jgi:hypothetical protein
MWQLVSYAHFDGIALIQRMRLVKWDVKRRLVCGMLIPLEGLLQLVRGQCNQGALGW